MAWWHWLILIVVVIIILVIWLGRGSDDSGDSSIAKIKATYDRCLGT